MSHLAVRKEVLNFPQLESFGNNRTYTFNDTLGKMNYEVGVPGYICESDSDLKSYVDRIDTFENRLEETKKLCQEKIDQSKTTKNRALRALAVLAVTAAVAGLAVGIVYGGVPVMIAAAVVTLIAASFMTTGHWVLAYPTAIGLAVAIPFAPFAALGLAITYEGNVKSNASQKIKSLEDSHQSDLDKANSLSRYLKENGETILAHFRMIDKKLEENQRTLQQGDGLMDSESLSRAQEIVESRKKLAEMISHLEESLELAK